MRKHISTALILVALAGSGIAQESPTATLSPSPSAAARNIRISFVPPPLDGTISLGIYDAKGKLVRTLFREADINEFKIGNDALSTTWDGKDDAGQDAPAGKYSAHGFVVGDLKIEGVGFFFNDWITTPDGPRFSRIRSIAMQDANLLLAVDLVPAATGHVLYDVAEKSVSLKDTDPDAAKPSVTPQNFTAVDPIMLAAGRDGSTWVIDRVETGSNAVEVKQYSASGEFMRRLPIAPNDPRPTAIAASSSEDKIFLLEEGDNIQRVRGLTLTGRTGDGGEQSVSEWKVDFEKTITGHKEFAIVDGKPVASAQSQPAPEKVKVKLQANALLNDDRVTVEVAMAYDADGSYLKAADGVPLCTISETQNLVRTLVVGRGSNVVYVFQDDGAVIEQFRVTGVDQMMTFDCGGFELK